MFTVWRLCVVKMSVLDQGEKGFSYILVTYWPRKYVNRRYILDPLFSPFNTSNRLLKKILLIVKTTFYSVSVNWMFEAVGSSCWLKSRWVTVTSCSGLSVTDTASYGGRGIWKTGLRKTKLQFSLMVP